MARKALAWLAVLGLVGPAGAQEVIGGQQDKTQSNPQGNPLPGDIPDNMDVFRETPQRGLAPSPQETGEQEGVGGAGTAGTGEQRRGELYGQVVDVHGNQLWLRHGDAVFPLALTEDTRFTPDRHQALQPGQEVRARFTLEGEGYVVNALEPLGQAPGSGQRAVPPR